MSIKATPYIEIHHDDENITNIQDFISKFSIERITAQELLDYDSNGDNIYASYREEDKQTYSKASVLLLRTPVLIKVPNDKLDKETLPIASNNVFPNTNIPAFYDKNVVGLFRDPEYRQVLDLERESANGNKLYVISNYASVWMWCKALGTEKEEGLLINVTPFIESLTTNVGENVGNFTVKLPPLVCEFNRSEERRVGKE